MIRGKVSVLIAQLTDLHIKRPGELIYGTVDSGAMLDRAVAHLLRLDPAPDIVLLTGDLVDGGHPEEYARLRHSLAPIKQPVYVIPGNHDERGAFRAAFADHAYLPRNGEFLNYAIDDYPVRLVALDTLVPGQVGGAVDGARLSWLEARLQEAPDRPTMVIMHHPPFEVGVAHLDAYPLRGAAQFGELLSRHPQIERVICGHAHQSMSVRWHGTPVTVCPSTAHQFANDLRPGAPAIFTLEPPGFQLHQWRPGVGLITHTIQIGEFLARKTRE